MATIAASPTMVGAVTTLIVIVAVFLAYNANAGLPFVPVYRVSIEIPDASAPDAQQRDQDRRPPGRRGRVDRRDPVRRGDGDGPGRAARTRPSARRRWRGREAQPEARQGPPSRCPRTRCSGSATGRSFGLKYLEIIRGEGEPAPEGFVFDGLDDEADSASACPLPGDPAVRERGRAPRTAASSRRPSSTTSTTPSTRRRGPTPATTSRASATRSPAAAPRSTTRSTASSRCSAACAR